MTSHDQVKDAYEAGRSNEQDWIINLLTKHSNESVDVLIERIRDRKIKYGEFR